MILIPSRERSWDTRVAVAATPRPSLTRRHKSDTLKERNQSKQRSKRDETQRPGKPRGVSKQDLRSGGIRRPTANRSVGADGSSVGRGASGHLAHCDAHRERDNCRLSLPEQAYQCETDVISTKRRFLARLTSLIGH